MLRPAGGIVVLALLAAIADVHGQQTPAPFAAGDPKAGKAIAERDCVSCHAQQFAGDADRIYTRPDHRVKSPQKLLAQVQACNTNLGKSYFPEEEEHIAAYLNAAFYHFPP